MRAGAVHAGSLRVLTLDERAAEWEAALAQLHSRRRDVYFSTPYQLLWQLNGDGRALGAVFESSLGFVLYPFLLRDLATVPWLGEPFGGLHDISSAYGYGGPLIQPAAAGEPLVNEFRAAFGDWCRAEGVVSEFVRCHPILHTEEGLAGQVELWAANETVLCRLGTTQDHLAAMSAAARRNLRKAQRSGLRFGVEDSDDAYRSFQTLYRETMRRRGAAAFYLFSERHFLDFRRLLGERQSLLVVRHQGQPIAAALFMRSDHYAHYHLGGSDASALPLRPNNLLFFEAMNWAAGLGLSELHLGGGYRAGGEDELFRFKAGFSPLRSRLFVGRAVHLPAAYERAVARRASHGPGADSGFFPPYRAPLPT